MRPARPGTATIAVALLGMGLALTGCAGSSQPSGSASATGQAGAAASGADASQPAASPRGSASGDPAGTGPVASATIAASPDPAASGTPTSGTPTSGTPTSGSPTSGSSGSPAPGVPQAADQASQSLTLQPLGARPLSGKVIVIDPGHNGGNGRAASRIAQLVNIGNGTKACDTTGAQTNAGYAESAFTWDVANRLAALLRQAGATVVLTRSSNTGVGPCITERAAIGNRAHADAAISIHADGAPTGGYGFHVIEPLSIGRNAAIVGPSDRLARAIRATFAAGTGEAYSTYTGGGRALTTRSDLGGLNLSTVPKVFIECANMRNAGDAGRLTSPVWRQRAAVALAAGLTAYLHGS